MMFDVMKLRPQTAFRCPQRTGEIVFKVTYLSGVVQPILNLTKNSRPALLNTATIPSIRPFPFTPSPFSLFPCARVLDRYGRSLRTAHCPLPTLFGCARCCEQNLLMQVSRWIA